MIRRMCATTLGTLALLVFGGCATSFTGSPHVENGRSGCEEKCKGVGMKVAGMVYMGEYSSACVCEVPGGTAGHAQFLVASTGAIAGAGAGVAMQMQRQAQQSRAH